MFPTAGNGAEVGNMRMDAAHNPEIWERLVASGRSEPNRSFVSPDDPPEPDALAPNARVFYYDMLSQELETLTLKRRFEATGLFGVGLQVSDDPPHVVQRVSRLLDVNRRNVSDTVRIGDTLYSVNDFQVEMSSIETVEQIIYGDMSSIVRLTFCDRNRQKYDVTAIRHVPISVWEQERVWYEIKPEFQGKDLRCDASIVLYLETIRFGISTVIFTHHMCARCCAALSSVGRLGRALMSKSGAVPADLLKDFSHVQTTLGFRIGVKSVNGRLMSCVVQQVQREGVLYLDKLKEESPFDRVAAGGLAMLQRSMCTGFHPEFCARRISRF